MQSWNVLSLPDGQFFVLHFTWKKSNKRFDDDFAFTLNLKNQP